MPTFQNGTRLVTVRSLLNDTGLRKSDFAASEVPTATYDERFGWEVGSRIFAGGVEYVCKSAATDAAVWEPATDAAVVEIANSAADNALVAKDGVDALTPNVRKANFVATRAPLPSDDETQGYEVGSRWQFGGQEWLHLGEGRWIFTFRVTPYSFGAKADGSAFDDTPAVQEWLGCPHRDLYWAPGTYRINGTLTLPSGKVITGIKGQTVLRQFGSALFTAPDDLKNLTLQGLTLDYRATTDSVYDVAFALKGHTQCIFRDYEFVRYDDQTIIERMPTQAATINTIDNRYDDWQVSACRCLDIAIGLEGYYYKHVGDGTTTSINTGVVWPERNLGSVTVLKEYSARRFAELARGTDFTVSYDASDVLTVNLAAAATANERIHIWPSSPRTDGNRRPISNNVWSNIRCMYVFSRGFQAIRWVDAETHLFPRLLAAADHVRLFVTNPYTTRTGQGGDYMAIEDAVLGKMDALISNSATITAMEFGPGSLSMQGRGIRMDQLWLHSSANKSLAVTDNFAVTVPGTVSGTVGSPVVTGTGTSFLRDFTLIGSDKDLIEIGGAIYGIESIDSDTQITLLSNLQATVSGAAIKRVMRTSAADAQFSFASMGDGFYPTQALQSGEVTINSLTKRGGVATIPTGAGLVDVKHGLRRLPRADEIILTPNANTGGHSVWITLPNATTLRIHCDPAATSDLTFGWQAHLRGLN